MGSWNIIEISFPLILVIAFSLSPVISTSPSSESNMIEPVYSVFVSSCSFIIDFVDTLFPQPLSPTTPCISPFFTDKSTPWTAYIMPLTVIRFTHRSFISNIFLSCIFLPPILLLCRFLMLHPFYQPKICLKQA